MNEESLKRSAVLCCEGADSGISMGLGAIHDVAFAGEDGILAVTPFRERISRAPEPIELEHEGSLIAPVELLPMHRDAKSFMLDRNDKGSIFSFNAEVEQMVGKIASPLHFAALVGLSPVASAAQLNPASEFIAHARNQIYVVGARCAEKVARPSRQRLSKARFPGFTQVVTSGAGAAHAASKEGAARAFDCGLGKRARISGGLGCE